MSKKRRLRRFLLPFGHRTNCTHSSIRRVLSKSINIVDMSWCQIACCNAHQLCTCKISNTFKSGEFDSLLLIGEKIESFNKLAIVYDTLKLHEQIDSSFYSTTSLLICRDAEPKRIIFSPVGSLNGDYDDVRRFFNAGSNAMKRAIQSGSKKPYLLCVPSVFEFATFAAVSGALDVTYISIEKRMEKGFKSKIEYLGGPEDQQSDFRFAEIVHRGKIVTRDIGGGSPEIMTPPKVREYVLECFKDAGSIMTKIIDDPDVLQREFPLFSAVNRASRNIERHRGCIIELSYTGSGPISQTIFLVGKGITYDTGGADLKVGGSMRFMSFDKIGAGTVAGFFKMLSEVKPSDLKVIGLMAMARNNIGEECYVSDEIIKSRSGTVISVGNTDAEGRMAMADVLCYAKELALKEANPVLYTIATLTGHVGIAYGSSFSAIVPNKVAIEKKMDTELKQLGHDLADPSEISYLRQEDFDFISYPGDKADVLQCNTLPSSRTPRGHIFPAAFLIKVSGLDQHGSDTKSVPLPYLHLDIASAAMPLPGTDIARPATLASLAQMYLKNSASNLDK